MQGGGIGFTNKNYSLKGTPEKGDKIVMLGGDNYRIGMGGGAVSSVATGEFEDHVELNAVQRANPELQKRVFNAIRALTESNENPIISIHDHGAGGHLNCLSELVESTGGKIDTAKLPVGDPTLSQKEVIGNESQERMGLVVNLRTWNCLIELQSANALQFMKSEKLQAICSSLLKTQKPEKSPLTGNWDICLAARQKQFWKTLLLKLISLIWIILRKPGIPSGGCPAA